MPPVPDPAPRRIAPPVTVSHRVRSDAEAMLRL